MKQNLVIIVLVILMQLLFYYVSQGQGRVGIGTATPQAKLHVVGNLRIDTVTTLMTPPRIATLDSLGVVHSYPFDSLTGHMESMVTYSEEVDAVATTYSDVPQVRVTLDLSPGSYIIFAYCEVFNTSFDAGVRAWFYEAGTELAWGIVYSNTATFGSWSTFRMVNPGITTSYSLSWSSWPNATPSLIRRARIIALKLS